MSAGTKGFGSGCPAGLRARSCGCPSLRCALPGAGQAGGRVATDPPPSRGRQCDLAVTAMSPPAGDVRQTQRSMPGCFGRCEFTNELLSGDITGVNNLCSQQFLMREADPSKAPAHRCCRRREAFQPQGRSWCYSGITLLLQRKGTSSALHPPAAREFQQVWVNTTAPGTEKGG